MILIPVEVEVKEPETIVDSVKLVLNVATESGSEEMVEIPVVTPALVVMMELANDSDKVMGVLLVVVAEPETTSVGALEMDEISTPDEEGEPDEATPTLLKTVCELGNAELI